MLSRQNSNRGHISLGNLFLLNGEMEVHIREIIYIMKIAEHKVTVMQKMQDKAKELFTGFGHRRLINEYKG